jgi:hemerythrin
MQRLVLTDELLTGLAAVDEQHNQLFAWGNALIFPEGGSLDALELRNGLRFLAAYVDFHFATEEAAMQAEGYERIDAHRWQHRHFRREIEQLHTRNDQQGPSEALALQLHYLLYDWFIGHIEFSDGDYAAWREANAVLSTVQPVTADAMRQLGLNPELVKVVGPGMLRA